MFMRYIPADIVVRRVNFVGGGPMADGHYAVACRADTGLIYVRHGRARYCRRRILPVASRTIRV